MELAEWNTKDAVAIDSFALPSALKEAAEDIPGASAVRVSRSRGDAFATVTMLCGTPGPVVATIGDSRTSFGRHKTPVLTLTAHNSDVPSLLAMLRNLVDALERTNEIAAKVASAGKPSNSN